MEWFLSFFCFMAQICALPVMEHQNHCANPFPPKHTSTKQAIDGMNLCSFFLHKSFAPSNFDAGQSLMSGRFTWTTAVFVWNPMSSPWATPVVPMRPNLQPVIVCLVPIEVSTMTILAWLFRHHDLHIDVTAFVRLIPPIDVYLHAVGQGDVHDMQCFDFSSILQGPGPHHWKMMMEIQH